MGRDPEADYARYRYACPGCGFHLRVPSSCNLTVYAGQQVAYWYLDTATKVKQIVTCSALDGDVGHGGCNGRVEEGWAERQG